MVGDFFGFTAVDLIMKDISLDMFNQMKKLLSFGENIEIINILNKRTPHNCFLSSCNYLSNK